MKIRDLIGITVILAGFIVSERAFQTLGGQYCTGLVTGVVYGAISFWNIGR